MGEKSPSAAQAAKTTPAKPQALPIRHVAAANEANVREKRRQATFCQ
jgi:hypothetical protein